MSAIDRPDAVHWRDAAGDDPIQIDADRFPELFDGVLGKRVIAFLVDWALLAVATVFLTIVLAILGIFTLGLLWPLIGPLAALMWVAYFAFTIGGATSATPGMTFAGVEVRTWDGARPGIVQGALQSLIFWISWSVTIFVILVPLFNQRRRCLHDYLIGTVVINTPDKIPPDNRVISG